MNTKKCCSDCKEYKDLQNFYPHNSSKVGKRIYCNICYKRRHEKSYIRRIERLKQLPNTLKKNEEEEIRTYFDNCCALTGGKNKVVLDHFIPIAWEGLPSKYGLGGTTSSNMLPLESKLNNKKNSNNPFHWFEKVKDKYMLSEDNWQKAIEYLAGRNGLTVLQFKNRVNCCYQELIVKRLVENLERKFGWEERPEPMLNRFLRHGVNIQIAVKVYGSKELNNIIHSANIQGKIRVTKERLRNKVENMLTKV
ncbi:hypothetical protein ACFQ4X_05525 [Fictibacillus halophilus]|uniref:hypothetical protein n=1 Tax=Fictibacillus halophilus TaxID=1610490 RepID=UPI003640D652